MKNTSQKLAKLASLTLLNKNSSETAKKLAGSVLSQTKSKKETSTNLEKIASKVLKSNKYSKNTKSLAASTLSQSTK